MGIQNIVSNKLSASPQKKNKSGINCFNGRIDLNSGGAVAKDRHIALLN